MPKSQPANVTDLSAQVEAINYQRQQRQGLRQRLSDAWSALSGRSSFNSRAFGPGQPQQPQPGPDGVALLPRQFNYPTAVNLSREPRRENPQMTPFEQLRNLAALYDVAAMCIAARIEEMQGLNWSIVARDKRCQADLQDACDAATTFFVQPDGLNDFYSWIGMLLYENLTTDAMTLYRRLDNAGRLYGLEVVDGSTIKPILDERGRTVAYQQIIQGMVESQYRRGSSDQPDEHALEFGPHEMIYKPRYTRPFTPYGSPPTEWIILRINTALRKQTWDMAWFTDGNVPEMLATAPEGMSTLNPDQLEEFEMRFNAVLEGSDAARRKVRFIPWAMNFHPSKPFSYETSLDEWMLRITCAAYSVPPQELGFTNDVNRASAELQEAVNERRGLKPLSQWLKATLFDPLLKDLAGPSEQRTLSLPGAPTRASINPFTSIEWQWRYGDKVDELVQAQTDQIYLGAGVLSPNEIRTMRFGDQLDGPAPGVAQTAPPLPPAMLAAPTGSGHSAAILPAGTPGPAQSGGQAGPASQAAPTNQAARADLRLWSQKAQKAIKSGRSADVAFVSESIPGGLAQSVRSGLAKAATPEAVRDVFAKAAQALDLPAPREAAGSSFFRQASDWSSYG
jgi:hypothetical protein